MLPFGTMKPTQSLKIAQEVYAQVPYMAEVFEKEFNQKLLARIADGGYNLGTSFEWNTVDDLKGQKLAGAGLNLKWLEYAGATPVQSALPDAYTSMKTGVYNGWIMFPSAWVSLKLYEPGPYYTKIGFGSITWHGLTINMDTWNRLPADVQEILLEVAKDFEEQTGSVNEAKYDKDIDKLIELGTQVRELPADVRADWANSLSEWPQIKADELDAQGLPASQVLKLTLETAEKLGYEWPNRYQIK
jgi:TRAP-type C4-dicarboxylate transport system substrate-binding protein